MLREKKDLGGKRRPAWGLATANRPECCINGVFTRYRTQHVESFLDGTPMVHRRHGVLSQVAQRPILSSFSWTRGRPIGSCPLQRETVTILSLIVRNIPTSKSRELESAAPSPPPKRGNASKLLLGKRLGGLLFG